MMADALIVTASSGVGVKRREKAGGMSFIQAAETITEPPRNWPNKLDE